MLPRPIRIHRASLVTAAVLLLAGFLVHACAWADVARPPAPVHPARVPAPSIPLERDTLAWAGDRAVTALDLVQRIEWMPWMEKHGPASMDSAKTRALEALVGEALLARESERRFPLDTASITPLRAALRRALTRDALYQQVASEVPAPGKEQVERIVRALHPGARPAELPALRRGVADSLRAARGEERAAQFLMDHLAGRRVEVDSAAFMLLADSLRALMLLADDAPVPGGGILLPPEAADALTGQLAGSLGRTLAHMPGGPLTLGDALDDLHFYVFAVRSLERRRFLVEFNECLRRIVEGELMAREGARRGLDESPQVRHDLDRWSATWRANALVKLLVEPVRAADDDAFRTLALREPQRARELCEVDVSEILCGSRAQAQALLGELAMGARFDSLATMRTRRAEWANSGGRSGWFAVSERPELGYAALLAPRDSLIGPIALSEGFTLLRVHGRRLRADSTGASAILEHARAIATGELRVQHVARTIADLADTTRVEMNLAALRRVRILPANMVVKRTLGFGGGMTASPSLMPLWHWANLWRGRAAPSP